MDRWREYFDKLFNGESEGPTLELDDSFDDTNRCFVRRIQELEIGEALKRMKVSIFFLVNTCAWESLQFE